MLTSLKLLITAGLGVGYLLIAFLVVHPHADPEYDAHYLHRTADCWIPSALRAKGLDQAPPSLVAISQLNHPESCRYLRRGWWMIEGWGVWAHGDEATLELPRERGARTVELTLRGVPAPGPAIPVRFVLNGRTTDDNIAPGTTTTIAFPLPPDDAPYNPDMHLTFGRNAVVAGPTPHRSGKPEMLRVGLGLIAIRYLPTPPMADTGSYRREF
jgi:hypothetical protein